MGAVIDISVEIAGIRMKNPVLVASGTFGYGEEFSDFFDLGELGAIVSKSITLLPRAGNPPPRICETPSGMLNSIGLQNVGLDNFIRYKMPFLRKVGVPIIVSVSGEEVEEYVRIISRLNEVDGVAGIELNVSCPNVSKGGIHFGSDTNLLRELVQAVRKATDLPLIVKLSPNVTDVTDFARIAEAEGADAISLINTLIGMAIDVKTRSPKLANIVGGLSGPAIKPIGVRMVWQVANAVKIPIIGMGGITSAEDALEFIIAGASAVAVGTANFINPTSAIQVIAGIKEYMLQFGIESFHDLIGSLKISAKQEFLEGD